jgi:hypothetical protein
MIAISIKDGQLRFGRFSADGKGVKLDLVNQVTASSLELSSVISSLSKEIPMKGEDIFLSLGEEYIQCDIVSMESGLDLSEIEHFIVWQMEQKYGSLWPEMKYFYQEIREDEKTIMVAVNVIRESIHTEIRTAIEQAEGTPVWLEADIFSLSRVLDELDDGRNRGVALFEPLDDTIRALFHDRGQLAALAEFAITKEDLQLETVRGDGEFVKKYIEEFERYISDNELDSDVHLFLAGHLPPHAKEFVPEKAIDIISPVLPFEEEDGAGNFAGDGLFSSILGLSLRSIKHA